NESTETQLIVELLRAFDSILAEHGVGDKKNFVRVNRFFELAQFLHQRFVDMEPSGSIDDHHVMCTIASLSNGVLAELKRRVVRLTFPQPHGDISRYHLQLLARCRPVHVNRDQDWPMATPFQPLRELSR